MGTYYTKGNTVMRNPELACDWCGDEVVNGEGVYVDDDRVCSECAVK
jgi:formylmethanofuran dehydrogenase subunit E